VSPPMRRALLAISLLAVALPGCKAKQLEAELAQVRDQLLQTETERDAARAEGARLAKENQSYQERIGELESELGQLTAQLEDLAKKQGMTAKELAELREEKAKREKELKVYKDLFAQLKALVDAGTIEVVFRKGRMTVKLSNAILFDSGQAKLRPQGEEAVGQLVPALKSVGQREFLVAGHTDNVPIKTARYRSNWELSTARSVSMVDAMIQQGYPPSGIGAAGFAEFDPIADNATEDGREQNRRIEIILMPNLGEIPGMKEMLKGGSKS
jgi:chemotaxis protein MotB